jgi:HSP20 family molecular chaperone IbpA
MKWIDEMFTGMEKDKAAESARLAARGTKVERTERREKQVPGAPEVWSALFSSIENDVSDFNKHQKRAGKAPVSVSHRHNRCEVNLPGMQSKRLVLTLENNDLYVSVHPDFPNQRLTITIEPDADGKHGFWVLGECTEERAKLSAQQLSEYLLKPILASASIN